MRVFPFLFLLIFLVHSQPPDTQFDSNFSFVKNSYERFFDSEIQLSKLDLLLLCVCFLLAFVFHKRFKSNSRLGKQIVVLRNLWKKDLVVVDSLDPFMEECRSKNSGLEMPLRKINRQCDGIISDMKKQLEDVQRLQDKFQTFKGEWQQQSEKIIPVTESTLLTRVEVFKVRAELDALKDYIGKELKSVKFVEDYNKSLIDEAEEDIDRVLISEGI